MPFRVTAAAVGAALLFGAAAPAAYATDTEPGAPAAVQLTTARGDAPKLAPGVYQTTAPTGETEHYASITRPKGGSVAVAIFGAVHASLTTADGETTCSSGTTTLSHDVTGYTFVSADATETKRQSYLSDDCKSATHLILELTADDDSSGATATAQPKPLQFVVTTEPKVKNAGAPAPKSAQDEIKAPSRSTPDSNITLSDKLYAPTTLTAGKSYPVTLKPGTIGVARVRVGWGQRLAASIDAPRNGTNVAPPASLDLVIDAFSPQWAPVGGGSRTSYLYKQDGTEKTAGTYTAPVSAANRSVDYGDAGDVGANHAQWTTVAGWYYVVVRAAADDDKDAPPPSFRLPARLNIEVTGTPSSGPTYVDTAGTAVAAPPATQLSQGGSTGSGSSSTTLLRIGGTAVVLVLAAAAVAILLRRRA
ncbi:hypothetical protein [Flexivirga oryzae]|uniref:Gram-positive cocci surface proteins LPxTG domain-containing protein n=1 Tax=Flexivirga oryzae TaxID=1794944 RepID=A0A839ND94_9MICO|nr:hypothetical protein [Flexivirga oryzae]MBB2892512.1 hypothetical protein [Flexivirga oryzae]